MIKRIKESELPSLEDLDVEILLIDHGSYFEAILGDYYASSYSEKLALHFLAKNVQGKVINIDGKKVKIPLRLK